MQYANQYKSIKTNECVFIIRHGQPLVIITACVWYGYTIIRAISTRGHNPDLLK